MDIIIFKRNYIGLVINHFRTKITKMIVIFGGKVLVHPVLGAKCKEA